MVAEVVVFFLLAFLALFAFAFFLSLFLLVIFREPAGHHRRAWHRHQSGRAAAEQ